MSGPPLRERILTVGNAGYTDSLEADGLLYSRNSRYRSMDDRYMFKVEQSVENTSGEPVTVFPYGLTVQRGMPRFLKNFMILHEGPVGVIGTTLKRAQIQQCLQEKRDH